jgi:hypothetical protein
MTDSTNFSTEHKADMKKIVTEGELSKLITYILKGESEGTPIYALVPPHSFGSIYDDGETEIKRMTITILIDDTDGIAVPKKDDTVIIDTETWKIDHIPTINGVFAKLEIIHDIPRSRHRDNLKKRI